MGGGEGAGGGGGGRGGRGVARALAMSSANRSVAARRLASWLRWAWATTRRTPPEASRGAGAAQAPPPARGRRGRRASHVEAELDPRVGGVHPLAAGSRRPAGPEL